MWHWTGYRSDKLCFVLCLVSELRMARTQTTVLQLFLALLWRHRGGGSVGRAPTLNPTPWHLSYNWGKSWKSTDRLAERRSADQRPPRFVQLTWPLRAMAATDLLAPAALDFRVRGRCQPSVSVSICHVAVIGVLQSKLAFRALMWSAKSGTPRSSCICLLLTYQGAH
jgi:hypothetical protein